MAAHPPTRSGRPAIAGLVAALAFLVAFAAAGLWALRADNSSQPAPSRTPATSEGEPRPRLDAGDVAGVRHVRRAAARQLRAAEAELDSCRRRHGRDLTRDTLVASGTCHRLPLSRLGLGGRTNATMLGAVAEGIPAGACRGRVLTYGAMMRAVGGEANMLSRGMNDPSRIGLNHANASLAAIRGLVHRSRARLRGSWWRECGHADPNADGPRA